MVKKLFALASVSALAGLVSAVSAAGCTTTETQTTPGEDSGTADAKKDSKNVTPEDDAGEEPSDLCYKEDQVDTSKPAEGYKNPRVQPGACEPGVTKVIEDLFDANPSGVKFTDIKDALADDPGCAECAFGKEADAEWAPLVEATSGQGFIQNGGGCVAVVSKNEDCGKAYFEWDLCLNFACTDCEGSDQQSCVSAVQSSACKDQTDALGTACGKDVNNYLKACNFTGWIKAQCVDGTVADGGNG
jgi:hypothetical protein